MSAYSTYNTIEEQKWVVQQLREEREKWVDDRASELITMFPKEPLQMSNLFLPQEAKYCLLGDKAQEEYNDFISAIAYTRAEEEWKLKFFCPF